ncbi:MAG: GNAT family N-acetyltransferase [Cyclobacteriaceae bacterium]
MMKPQAIVVRDVKSSEIETLRSIGEITFTESFESKNCKSNFEQYVSKNFSMPKILEEFENPGSQFYFATLSEKIVGYLKINVGNAQTEDTLESAMEVERIYVLAEHQGKRIGQVLFDKALDLARSQNLKRIWLGVWDQNIDAIRFYERNGFVKFTSHPFKLGDEDQTDILMKMEL